MIKRFKIKRKGLEIIDLDGHKISFNGYYIGGDSEFESGNMRIFVEEEVTLLSLGQQKELRDFLNEVLEYYKEQFKKKEQSEGKVEE